MKQEKESKEGDRIKMKLEIGKNLMHVLLRMFHFIIGWAVIIIMLMLVVKCTQAYSVQFKHPDINQTKITGFLGTINESYFEGVKVIKFYNGILSGNGGRCFASGVIWVDVKYMPKDNTYHELKHWYCWKKFKYMGHQGCFMETIGLGRY